MVLLDARGHTPGHLAVSMRTPKRHYIHSGDAADQVWEYRKPGPSIQGRLLAWNVRELRRTYASLRSCEAMAQPPTIVPSHDRQVFESLPQKPAI